MHWKRSTCGLLLGGSLSIMSLGCAAVDAIVSSPAGNSASQGSPERFAAIGRVFENQGKLAQAQAMYRKALSSDPSNAVAQERLNYLASRSSNRKFTPRAEKTQTVMAVADALNARRHTKPRRLSSRTAKRVQNPEEVIEQGREAVMASLTPSTVGEDAEAYLPHASAEKSGTTSSDAGDIDLTTPGWTLDESIQSDAAEVALSFVSEEIQSDIATVGFEGNDDNVATIASVDPTWKPASRFVSIDQLLEWSETPADNTDNLLFALTGGEDDAVKAFAATLLAECPDDNPEINAALRNVCTNGSPLLRVSSRDTLIQRGDLSEDGVNDLLGLLSVEDTSIQAQAATSLRNLSGTEWAPQCVAGLSNLLTNSDPAVVSVAATTLGDFGTEASSSRSVLMTLTSTDKDEQTQAAAKLALNRIPVPDVSLDPADSGQSVEETKLRDNDEYLPIVD